MKTEKEKTKKEPPRQSQVRGGLFDWDMEFDETDPKASKRIKAFLKEYKLLCKKHGCLVVADGTEVEVVPSKDLAEEDDPWGIVEETKGRGWEI